MNKGPILINEEEKKQIRSLYGLILEANTVSVKLYGGFKNMPSTKDDDGNETFVFKFENLKITFSQNNIILKTIIPLDKDKWEVNLNVDPNDLIIEIETIYENNPKTKVNKIIDNLPKNGEIKYNIDLANIQNVQTFGTVDKVAKTDNIRFKVFDSETKIPLSGVNLDFTLFKKKYESNKIKTEASTKKIVTDKDGLGSYGISNALTTKKGKYVFGIYGQQDAAPSEKDIESYLNYCDSNIRDCTRMEYTLKIDHENYNGYYENPGVILVNEFIMVEDKETYIINVPLVKKTASSDFVPVNKELYVPKFYQSTKNVFYGHGSSEDDRNEALEMAKKSAYDQFLKTIRKKYRDNEDVKSSVSKLSGEIVFSYPQNIKKQYFIVKYKRPELKRFVRSLFRPQSQEEIDPVSNIKIKYYDISLDVALTEAKRSNRMVFVLLLSFDNEDENSKSAIDKLNSNEAFVKQTNGMIPIKIRADEDVDASYKKLKLIFENNGKSFESVPRIIYITKDEKINSQFDYDEIMGS